VCDNCGLFDAGSSRRAIRQLQDGRFRYDKHGMKAFAGRGVLVIELGSCGLVSALVGSPLAEQDFRPLCYMAGLTLEPRHNTVQASELLQCSTSIWCELEQRRTISIALRDVHTYMQRDCKDNNLVWGHWGHGKEVSCGSAGEQLCLPSHPRRCSNLST
jgi:hypothetical protein